MTIQARSRSCHGNLMLHFWPESVLGGSDTALVAGALADQSEHAGGYEVVCKQTQHRRGAVFMTRSSLRTQAARAAPALGCGSAALADRLEAEVPNRNCVPLAKIQASCEVKALALRQALRSPVIDLDDLVQDAFAEVFRSLRNFDPELAGLRTFTDRCSDQWLLGQRRRRSDHASRPIGAPLADEGAPCAHESRAFSELDCSESFEHWQAALSEGESEFLWNRRFFSSEKLAQESGKHASTVRRREQRMRRNYERHERGDPW